MEKQVVECTHTYNGTPVKIITDVNYLQSADYADVYDPKMGNRFIVPTKELKPISSSIKLIVTKVQKKKSEPKKKEEKKKKVKKESVITKINTFINEVPLSDREEDITNTLKEAISLPIRLSLQGPYTGTVKFIKDLKTMSGELFKAGKFFFVKKEPNKKEVKIFKDAQDLHRVNPPIKIVPFDVLNNYIEISGMRGLPNTFNRPAIEQQEIENGVQEYLNEKKKTKNFLPDIKKGAFHRWLGKSEDEPITNSDIKKGLASEDPHVVRMANFARNASKWKKTGPKNEEEILNKLSEYLK